MVAVVAVVGAPGGDDVGVGRDVGVGNFVVVIVDIAGASNSKTWKYASGKQHM